jgi:hypothetical protein
MKLSIITGVLAALAASAAIANDPTTTTTSSTDAAATFKSLDTDGNGRISESEAASHAELSAGYRTAVSDSASGMTMEEFNSWYASRQQSTQAPPSN